MAQPTTAPRVWMVGPTFDVTFFVATALVTFLPWIAVDHYHVNPFYIIGAVAVTSNGPHLASTWSRVYMDGNERWKRPIHYWVMPALIAAFVVTMQLRTWTNDGPRVIRSILFYWAAWHFVMQSWGILRIYQRRSGDTDARVAQLERVLLWLTALYPMLARLRTGPWSLLGAEIYHPHIPLLLVQGLAAALASAAIAYIVVMVVRARRGTAIHWIRPALIASSFVGFLVPFVLMKSNGTAAFASASAWHAFQYMGVVWFFNRNKWKGGVDRNAPFISWLSQPGRAPLYFMGMLAAVGVFYAIASIGAQFKYNPDTWASLVWLSLTLGHYWLDGVIWKLRKPELQKQLVAA